MAPHRSLSRAFHPCGLRRTPLGSRPQRPRTASEPGPTRRSGRPQPSDNCAARETAACAPWERLEPPSSRHASLTTPAPPLPAPAARLPPRPKSSHPVPWGQPRARPWLCMAGRAQGSPPCPTAARCWPAEHAGMRLFLLPGCRRRRCCTSLADDLGPARPVPAAEPGTGGWWAASLTKQGGGAYRSRAAGKRLCSVRVH